MLNPTAIARIATIPPHNPDAERSVIGSILINPPCFAAIYEILNEETFFYLTTHQLIYAAMIKLFENSAPIDIVTVSEELHSIGKLNIVGGPVAIHQMQDSTPGGEHGVYYAKIVAQHATMRQILADLSKLEASIYDGAMDDVIKIIQEILSKPIHDINKSVQISLGTAVHKLLESNIIDEYIPTGLPLMDKKFAGGLWSKRLYVFGGRPSMGKSVLAEQIAINVALSGKTVLYFASEMSNTEIAQRYLASVYKIPLDDIMMGIYPDPQDVKIPDEITKNIIIIDKGKIAPSEIVAHTKRLMLQHKISLVIVDHIHRLSIEDRVGDENGADYLTRCCAMLKNLAKDNDLAVVAMAQLNRAADSGNVKLRHLRGSGGIEAEADIAVLLDRLPIKEFKAINIHIGKGRYLRESQFTYVLDEPFVRFREPDPTEVVHIQNALFLSNEDKFDIQETKDNKEDKEYADDVPF